MELKQNSNQCVILLHEIYGINLHVKYYANALYQKGYSHIRIIGFSIGATIAWFCSNNSSVHKVVGFYGSRIRQYTDVVPNAETILIFGEQENPLIQLI